MISVTVFGRRWLVATLMLVFGTGLFLALIHTPVVRSWLLKYAVRTLDERLDIRLEADQLDFNLLTLDFELIQLSVARSDLPDAPFLTAERARVDLPWSAATGTLSFTTVELDRPTVSLIRSADTDWNLPDGGEDRAPGDARLSLPTIERFRTIDLGVDVRAPDYVVEVAGIGLEMTAARLDSQRIGGPLRLLQPARIRWGEQQTAIEALGARLAFDGETLEIESFDIRLPEGRLTVNGHVRSVSRDPVLDLTYDGNVVLASAAYWWLSDSDAAGQAVVSGVVTGPVFEPFVSAHVEASDVRWAEGSRLEFRADVRVERDTINIDEVSATYGLATVNASARLSIGDAMGPGYIEATWRDLDTGTLLSQLPAELPRIPAGVVSGSGQITWTTWHPSTIELTAEVRSRQPEPRAGFIPFEGKARVEIGSGRWRAEVDDLALPGMSVRSRVGGSLGDGGERLAATTVTGTATAEVTDLAQVIETFGLARAANESSIDLHGTAAMEVRLTGTLERPVANGHIRNARVGMLGIDDVELATTFAADRNHLAFEELTIKLGPNLIAGDVQIGLTDDTIDGAFDMTLPEVAWLAPALPEAVAPSGRVEGRLVLGGGFAGPQLEATFEGREVAVAGRVIDSFTTAVRVRGDVVTIEALEAQQDDGRVRLEGRYAISNGFHELDASGFGLPLAALLVDGLDDSTINGQVSFDIASSGPWSDLNGNGHARVESLEWKGRPLGAVDLAASIEDGALHVDAVMPSLGATAAAEVGLVEDTSFGLTAELRQTDLQSILPPAEDGSNVSGIVSLTLMVTGDHRSLAAARIAAKLGELDGRFGATRVRLVEPGSVEYSGGQVKVDRIELIVNNTRLTLAGSLGSSPTDQLSANLTGELSDMETFVGWFASPGEPPAVQLNGAVETEVVLTGSFDDPVVSARINVGGGTVAIPSLPPAQSLELDVSYDAQTITVNELAAHWQGARVWGAGEIPAMLLADWVPAFLIGPPPESPQGRLTMSLDEITASVFEPFLDPGTLDDLEARASARLELEVDGFALEDVRAVLSFGLLDLTISAVPLSQRRETRLELADGRLEVRAFDLGNDDDYFTLGGAIDLQGDPTADLTVTAELDLRTASAFISGGMTEGNAFLIANVLGPVSDPEINGTLELTNAGIRLREPQLIVSDVNGALLLTRDTIQFHELSGDANGGPFAISGALDLAGLRPEGDVLLVGRGIAMELPEGVRTELDTDLAFTLSEDELALRGDITVARGAYREALLLTGGLLAALQEQESMTIVGLDDGSPLDAINLNVRIVTAEDIVIDNNYADASVGFDLRVRGTAGAPALT